MIPGMDLASQYDKTLQNTIGQSQRQRNETLRQSQSDVTDWAQRGASGFRGAGYNEVNPSTMPTMDDVTRSNLAPILGTYQEGGQTSEGYYGDINPYTVEGALKYASNAGFTDADTTLQQQAKETGQNLPSIFGHSLANEAARTWGRDYGNWKNQQTEANKIPNLIKDLQSKLSPELKQNLTNGDQIESYVNKGFVPGQDLHLDNGDYWHWVPGGPGFAGFIMNNRANVPEEDPNYLENMRQYNMGFLMEKPELRQLSEEEQGQNDSLDFFNKLYPEGSGRWYYNKGGKDYEAKALEYSPSTGFHENTYDSAPKGFSKYMPAVTMAVLSAMSPIGGAVASAARTGFNTGDWKQAIGQGALSYAGSSLGNAYGGDLGSAMNLSGDLAKNVGSGLISTGVNAAGNAALGNKVNWGDIAGGLLGSIGGSYLGGLANAGVGGGALGTAVGGGVRSLASGLASSAFGGNGVNARDLATRVALGAATPTLGNLFNSNESPQDKYQQNNLANAVTKNNKRV